MAAKVIYMVSQRGLGVHSFGLAWLLQSDSCQAAQFPKKLNLSTSICNRLIKLLFLRLK